MKILVIIPAYNEEENLGFLLENSNILNSICLEAFI